MEEQNHDVEHIRRLLGQMRQVPVPDALDKQVLAMGHMMVRQRKTEEPSMAVFAWLIAAGTVALILIGVRLIPILYLSSIWSVMTSYLSSVRSLLTPYLSPVWLNLVPHLSSMWRNLTSYLFSVNPITLVFYGAAGLNLLALLVSPIILIRHRLGGENYG
jgi:hypothetical protein